MSQVSLAYFASLFSDRQGTIYSLTSDSLVASLLLNLYSGYNRVVVNEAGGTSCSFSTQIASRLALWER